MIGLPSAGVKHYTPLTIFCHKEKYTKSEATTVARMLTSTETVTHRHHSNIHGKITENISDILRLLKNLLVFLT